MSLDERAKSILGTLVREFLKQLPIFHTSDVFIIESPPKLWKGQKNCPGEGKSRTRLALSAL